MQKKSRNGSGTSPNSNGIIKMNYDELQSIAVTAVDTLAIVKERCITAEAKTDVLEKLLNEAQEAIESRDLILNKYEGKELDPSYLKKFEELKAFVSNDDRFEEIRRKKMEDMKKKQEEILRQKYNFAPRY